MTDEGQREKVKVGVALYAEDFPWTNKENDLALQNNIIKPRQLSQVRDEKREGHSAQRKDTEDDLTLPKNTIT